MTKGYSLEQDLRLLMNNEKYSDIEIICENEKKLHGSRAILAARSEVFDRLLYNDDGTKENRISFSNINFSVMKIILEYIYTGSIKKESLDRNNIIETFYAADHFQLPSLQEFILASIKNTSYLENYSPELLSKIVDIMPLSEDNILLNLLVETVSIISLDTIEHGRLSIKALRHLLSCTYKKEKPFVTPEYEVFRYSAILAAKQVSNDAYENIMERLPALDQIKNSNQVQNNSITDHQKVENELEPLTHFIDFSQIERQILTDFIEPLGITSSNLILNVYRQIVESDNLYSSGIRGMSMYKFKESNYVWDESACGPKLIIEDNGKVVYAPNGCGHQSVRAKMPLDYKGIFEWSVIIEKFCVDTWVGVCASENLNYETWAGCQPTGWVLGTYGQFKNSDMGTDYCVQFRKDNTKVTVHLNMYKKTCAFSINDTKYKEISVKDLPSKLYPVVSLKQNGRLRILPYQKVNF
ncbi:BTB/POZ domain-containing protein [Rhizophagus diaphanus]|nr:BTB/POZ domain-containing protein [Rhizophagus diaphanus] [Rhizophagus sp. MUCL 43196]